MSRQKSNKSLSGSSKRWMQEHVDDPYVKQAQKDGYRSRASYKLISLQEKDRFIKPGMTVIDLGSAPGGWSQVASKQVGSKGSVIASDILPMDGIADVNFIQGDFTEQEVFDQLLKKIGDKPVSVVLSDMAPNMSGMAAVDQPRSMELVELAADMAQSVLQKGGCLVCKIFQGEDFDSFIQDIRKQYATVKIRKPPASRARSREVYLVAMGYLG